MRRSLLLLTAVATLAGSSFAQEKLSREQKVRLDKKLVEEKGFWIYNDLDEAYRRAEKSGKPVCVALRCIPCEECVKLDDELVDTDPEIRPLLEQFECVRIISTNSLDLDTFQYDTDQSWAVFMLNADKTIYGRFGTRSHRSDWSNDVSLTGLAEALRGSLELHKGYPANAASLAGKKGEPLEFPTPQQYPAHRDKYPDRIDYTGTNVVQSCIHCHQIGDARRDYYWHDSKPIPEQLLFPYPHPTAIGMVLDPTRRASVKEVTPGTAAESAGLRAGDSIAAMNGQPLLSIADVQWVLHHTPAEGGTVPMQVDRNGEKIRLQLTLGDGWRRADDTSWRVASWQMRRIATGGMVLQPLAEEQRSELQVESPMAFEATHVGQYNEHAAAKRAGFQKGDVLISYDGRSNFERETDLFAYVNENKRPGDQAAVELIRDGRKITLKLPVQK